MDMKKVMNNGNLYNDSCNGLSKERLLGKNRAFEYNHSHPSNQDLRNRMIDSIFSSVGKRCWIEPPINIAYGTHTTIGDDFYSNFNLVLIDDADIIIGDNVMFGPNVTLTTAGHPIHPILRNTKKLFSLPITIGNGV